MRTRSFLLMSIAAGVTLLSSCDKEGCMDETALNYDADVTSDDGSCVYENDTITVDTLSMVTLHAHCKMGTAGFAFDTEVTNWQGRKMKFTMAQMYVSNFHFHKDGGGMAMIDDSYLLIKPGTMMYPLGEIPDGHYNGMGFTVGVDSAANHADPATWPTDHALSANNPDHAHWGWDPGYIFIKVEGLVDTTAAMNGNADAPFAYHVGMDMLARDVMMSLHSDVDDDVTLMVNIDFLKLFDNIDLRQNRVSHSMGAGLAPAQTMVGNVSSAFSMP